ncbi:hypothetical protein B4U84_00030 [Westiellopsis prolifica IICB1]|nr:hypothetical protein B4U84_00030 [Westiellopsis prolifica IICB1]
MGRKPHQNFFSKSVIEFLRQMKLRQKITIRFVKDLPDSQRKKLAANRSFLPCSYCQRSDNNQL